MHGYDLKYATSAHSIWPPADAVGAMSVAAINQADWETGPQESYSSQGPTNDGRIKPNISGPDGVSVYTRVVGPSYGTSFSSPHVAGAASLLLSKYPGFTAAELQSTLESWAIDMGLPGKDNIYGYGRLNLLLVSPFGLLEDLKVYPSPFDSSRGHTQINFTELTADARIRIFTLAGKLVVDSGPLREQGTWVWDVKNREGERVARGIYIYLATNSQGEKKSGKVAIIE